MPYILKLYLQICRGCSQFAIQQTLEMKSIYCDLNQALHPSKPCVLTTTLTHTHCSKELGTKFKLTAGHSLDKHLSTAPLAPHYPRVSSTPLFLVFAVYQTVDGHDRCVGKVSKCKNSLLHRPWKR